MPVIEPGNTQQILQMSAVVEKIQVQQIQHLAMDQYQAETLRLLDALKRSEVQDLEESLPAEPSDPDSAPHQRQLRIKKKAQTTDTRREAGPPPPPFPENLQGSHLNITI